jgi:hypothetical protein
MYQVGQQVIVENNPGYSNFTGTVRGIGANEYYLESPGFSGWVPAQYVSLYQPPPPAYPPPGGW